MERNKYIEVANAYLERGLNTVPVAFKGKNPIIKEWSDYQSKKVTPKLIHEWSSKAHNFNIGVVTGEISNLTIVDVDGELGEEQLRLAGIELPETLKVKTRNGYHYYYQHCPDSILNNAVNVFKKFVAEGETRKGGVDIRTGGGQVVAPPSIHETGFQYQWVNEGSTIAPFPKAVLDYIKENKKADKKEKTEKEGKPLSQTIGEGSRNQALTSLTGSLVNLGLDKEAILQAVMVQNALLIEPLEDKEVETIVNSVTRYPITDKMYSLDDVGNMNRFIDAYADKYIYSEEEKSFLRYNGKTWTRKKCMKYIMDDYIARLELIPNEVDRDEDEEGKLYEIYDKFRKASRNIGSINKVIEKGIKFGLSQSRSIFDTNNFIINLKNGTFDMLKGVLRPHNSKDYLRKIANAEYDPSANCPTWLSFLEWAFMGDKELIDYVQRAIGYTFTGSTKEQVIFLLHGSGGNGKSTLIDVINHILGDYGATADIKTFVAGNDNNNSADYDIATLVGSRFVAVSESNKGVRLNESRVKKLSGNKTFKARNPHEQFFEFEPTFKMFLETNNLPTITDEGNSMWRRLKKIPFNNRIDEKSKDPDLLDKLIAEANGILNWCLKGAQIYLSEGLGTCSAIEISTEEYRIEGDSILQFMQECTVSVPGARSIKPVDLHAVYIEWLNMMNNGDLKHVYTHTTREFTEALKVKGYNIVKSGTNYVADIEISKDYQRNILKWKNGDNGTASLYSKYKKNHAPTEF